MATVALSAGDNIQTLGHDVAGVGDWVTLPAGNYFSQSVSVTTNTVTFIGVGAVAATDAAFDFTGGAQEDLWTSTAHGLSVGDKVYLSVGTGASPYAENTPYWVVAVPLATTFQLSASKGGAVLAGVGDSTSNWTVTNAAADKADVKIYGGPQITGFAASGSYWKAASGQTYGAEINRSDESLGVYARGAYKLMCSVDLAYYHHVASSSNLGDTPPIGATGNFFFDYGTKELWLSADPGAGIVVLSEQDRAFGGSGTGCTIQDVTVATFEPNVQSGAIGGDSGTFNGDNWTVENVHVTNIHGVGIQMKGDGCVINNSTINYIGQLGAGSSGGTETAAGPNLYQFTFYNNLVEYTNMKAYNPGFEAGATKFAWSDEVSITHNEIRFNKGFALWCDINVYDTTYKWNYIHDNYLEGIKHEISFCATIAENWIVRNGNDSWPGTGEWPSGSPDSGFGTAPAIAVDESNGLYDRGGSYGNPVVAPYGILIENNLLDDNHGGVALRERFNDNRHSHGSYPGGDAYDIKGITVQKNDVHWTSGKHGVFDASTITNPCSYSGVEKNDFQNNDYTINGAQTVPTTGFEYCGAVSFGGWQALGLDTTSAGADPPSEPYGIITPADIQLGFVDHSPTLYALDVIEGSGNITLGLIDHSPTLYALNVSALLTTTERINAGGPLISATPDWEADDTGHAYNDDTVGTSVVSNYSGAIDVTSVAAIALLNPPQALFHTERYDPNPDSMSFTFPGRDPSLRYKVRLFASENLASITGSGQRVFDVLINGSIIKDDWDLYAESEAATAGGPFDSSFDSSFATTGGSGTGLHVALVAEANAFPTAGGDLVITTTSAIQSALLNGIEVSVWDQNVTLGFIDHSPTMYPMVVQDAGTQQIDLGFIDHSPTLHDLAVESLATITLGLIDNSPTLYEITIDDEEGVTVSSELIGPFWFDVIDVDDTTGSTPSSASVSRSSTFLVGENDTLPTLTGYVRNGRDAILDLSATGINPSTITFSMKNVADGSIKVDEQTCTWDTSTHIVTYSWAAADTDVAGEFDGEVETTVASGKFTAPGTAPKIRITVGGEIS